MSWMRLNREPSASICKAQDSITKSHYAEASLEGFRQILGSHGWPYWQAGLHQQLTPCYPFASSVEIKETDGSSQIKQEPDPTW